ncbi:MAG: ATP-dependent DNA helicase RecG [Bacteroidota bacterium]
MLTASIPDKQVRGEQDAHGPIRYLRGIGPKRATVLENIGIRTFIDLLYYIPRSYLDRTNITKIRDLRGFVYTARDVTVVGRVIAQDVVRGRRGSARFILILGDETGTMECVWFGGVRFFEKMFRVGEVLAVSGRVTEFRGKPQVAHPDFDRLSVGGDEDNEGLNSEEFGVDWDSLLHTGAIVPQYRTTEELRKVGLDSRGFRRIMKVALSEKLDAIDETLSRSILSRNQLKHLPEVIRTIHFPGGNDELNEARRRLKFDELFFLQLLLAYRRREVKVKGKGISFAVESKLARQLVDSLTFKLTRAQVRAINEISDDMKSDSPMNRLLQGDVGSGKTVVALVAASLCVENGYQVAFMAPTEILAEQHYRTIMDFLKPISVNIRLLIGGQKKRLREDVLEDIRRGTAQIVVGTHALVQEHVEFANLGLIVIDEQHRFGVLQRANLRKKGLNPDVLVMTATPIPRTLSLTVYGDLDASVIDEMPKGRKPIQTLLKFDTQKDWVYNTLREQLSKGRQAYIVYPLVEESEKVDLKAAVESYEHLKSKVFPDFRLGLIHGRLPSDQKDEIMHAFKEGLIDILVSTTVIEVGIDVPNATVMVIEHAERYGLSQLHQLRGRIGRSAEQSLCVLVAQPWAAASAMKRMVQSEKDCQVEEERRIAARRLETIVKTTDGFKIAEVDLDIRGPGDFFGTRQSGLPDLRIANIITDGPILSSARREAFLLVEQDPQLRSAENQPIRQHFERSFKENLSLMKVG